MLLIISEGWYICRSLVHLLTQSDQQSLSFRAMNTGSVLSYSCCALPGPLSPNKHVCVQKNLIRLWSRLDRRQIVFSCWGLWNHNRITKLLECFEDNQCFNSSFWSKILAKPGVWPFQPKPSWVWWFKTRTRLESTGTSPGIRTLDFGLLLWTGDYSGLPTGLVTSLRLCLFFCCCCCAEQVILSHLYSLSGGCWPMRF